MAYKQSPHCDLVAFCGRTRSDRSLALSAELGVPLYTDLAEMLRKEKPDVVSVCTQEPEHAEVTIACLEAGCHVCCEKAMAPTVEDGERMVAAAEKAGRQLMIGYNYRFSPSALHLKKLVDSGRLGAPVFMAALTFGYCLHHTMDFVCHLGGDVEEVYAAIRTDAPEPFAVETLHIGDWIYSGAFYRSITLRFTSGALGTLISSDYLRVGQPAVRVDCVGAKARATMDDIVGQVICYTDNRQAEVWMPSLIMDRLDLPSTTVAADKAFVEAICEGREVPVPAGDGLRMLKLERAIMRSARDNMPVKV